MPRTTVPPGKSSKRSCSSASSCRGANFRLCATSETERPRSSRAALSVAPTASVILPPLQRLELGRPRETPAQLVGVALLGYALARAALYPHGKPQRFGVGRHEQVPPIDVGLQAARRKVAQGARIPELWDGRAGERIVAALVQPAGGQ